jgi:hypothetical protein
MLSWFWIVSTSTTERTKMPKYSVPMCRDTWEYIRVEVEADSPEEAEEKAYQEARTNWDLEWEPSDDSSKPYCTDSDDIEIIEVV